jgi:DNA-binding NarL/FixJ family response regulator
MVRRREPLLAADAEGEEASREGGIPLPPPAMRPAVTGWYVSAPIVSEGRVVGLLDADRKGQVQTVDELDQMILSVFADGFACIFERATLRDRLRAQLAQVREVMDTTDQLLDEVIETEIEVGLVDQQISTSVAHATSAIAEATPPASSGGLLTAREVEVIELIAAGETNAGIAARLLISESTVKSHVKHILRKLGASHRAEAVSRHLAGAGRRSGYATK